MSADQHTKTPPHTPPRPVAPGYASEAQAAVARDLEIYHRVADRRRASLTRPASDIATQIIRTVCETDPADPDLKDTICISVADLKAIMDAALADLALTRPAVPEGWKFLHESDQQLLDRFIETSEDDESFDIGMPAVKRLADLGVVRNCGFGRYAVTMFGNWVHEHSLHQKPPLPLMTNSDRDATQKAKLAAQKGGA